MKMEFISLAVQNEVLSIIQNNFILYWFKHYFVHCPNYSSYLQVLTPEISSFRNVVTTLLTKKVLILQGREILLPLSERTATGFYLLPDIFSPELLTQTLCALYCSNVLSCHSDFRSKFCRHFVSQALHV